MILVDTNVWSEASKPNGNRAVGQWLTAHRDELWLSVLVIAEIRAGIENPAAIAKRGGLEQWLGLLETSHHERTLPFDSAAAHVLGGLLIRKPQDAKMIDTMLAAQALAQGWPIATRNLRDFEWTDVELIDPWTA